MRGTKASDRSSILAHANVVNISAGVIIEREGTFLLIQEVVDGKKSYNFPSGKAHLDELIEQTARREALEETGYEVVLTDLASVYYYRTKKNSNDRTKDRITVRFNFWAHLATGTQKQRPTKDTASLVWVTRDDLQKLAAEHSFRNWIAKELAHEVLANKKAPLATLLQLKG